MRALIDFDAAAAFSVPATHPGRPAVEGLVLEGPQGWGEFSPRSAAQAGPALVAATEGGTVGWPDPVRGRVPVALTVDTADPDRAAAMVAATGCGTVRVPVGAGPATLTDDLARCRAAHAAVGPHGRVRLVLAAGWDPEAAAPALRTLQRACGGIEFAEIPAGTTGQLAALRRGCDVPVAIEAAGLEPAGSDAEAVLRHADVVVLGVAALGGVRRALRIAQSIPRPAVVGSPGETSLGLAAGLALAGALPSLEYACALGDLGALAGDLVDPARSLRPVDGQLPVAPMPPAPDGAALARFALRDPGRVRHWRALLAGARDRD